MDSRTGLPVVGMVGGGQLARMTHQAAIALGQSLRVLAESADDGAAVVAADTVVGSHLDLEALRRFAKGCDVITFDHEHVPPAHLTALAADGVTLRPSPQALRYAADKLAMRRRLDTAGIAVPRWRTASTLAEVIDIATGLAQGPADGPDRLPIVVKAITGGYDGRGVWVLDDVFDPAAQTVLGAIFAATGEVIAEEKVVLRRELAAMVARSPWGQIAAYPVVETVQRDGICVEVIAPAPDLAPDLAAEAQSLAARIATELDVVGILAVELFELDSGKLVVNELAMRPHNSGHWTIDGALTSQFEQHVRAVLDYPLGLTTMTAPAVVMSNVLGAPAGPGGSTMGIDERLHHLFAADPGVRVHLYGKQVRPGRKIGHVTVLGEDVAVLRERARRAARWLSEGIDE